MLFGASLLDEGNAVREHLQAVAANAKQSFLDTFLNEYGYLYDYVDGYMVDWSVRPNMIFPVAFDYSPLNQDRRRACLTSVPVNCSRPRVCVRFRPRVVATTPCM